MKRWIVIAIALAVGFLLLSYDRRTDDTGIEAGLLVATSLGLTLAEPRAAIAIALAIGLPIAAFSLSQGQPPALVAIAFSGAGAALGYALRRAAVTTPAR